MWRSNDESRDACREGSIELERSSVPQTQYCAGGQHLGNGAYAVDRIPVRRHAGLYISESRPTGPHHAASIHHGGRQAGHHTLRPLGLDQAVQVTDTQVLRVLDGAHAVPPDASWPAVPAADPGTWARSQSTNETNRPRA